MLHDYQEPVCRACCNHEGTDHIAKVIDKAREQKRIQGMTRAQPCSAGEETNPTPEPASDSHRYRTR